MAILRKQTSTPELTAIAVPDWWLRAFYMEFPEGSQWNEQDNGWLNEQYAAGSSPEEAFRQCRVINF